MRLVVPSLLLLAVACNEGSSTQAPSVATTEQEVSVVPAGQSCAQLGLGAQQFVLTSPLDGDYAIDDRNTFSFRYYDDTNTIFYFTRSTIRFTGVVVTIGDRALMWEMPGGADGWPSLHGPVDQATGDIYSPDQVQFCYDYELYVQPSPYANHAQQATWTITKSGRTEPLTLSEGQTELLEYTVTVRAGQPVAAGQYIDGPVFVQNKSPYAITVSSVTTMVGTIAAQITCPQALPFSLAPYTTLVCDFRADVPDTSDRNVVGSATSSHSLKVTTREVVASFSAHNTGTITVDRCVAVTDDLAPYNDQFLGSVCDTDGEQSFTFTAEVGPFACGGFTVQSAAHYTGYDTGATASAPWSIAGNVPCDPGCTLSAQYWKMHSEWGPRRYNPVWGELGELGENTPFFLSGGTYIQAMTRRAFGNPYWTLARTYIAAKLNQLNGAQLPPSVATAFDNATSLLTLYTPTQIHWTFSLRRAAVRAAATLKDFNQGRLGPGRCTCKPDLDSDD